MQRHSSILPGAVCFVKIRRDVRPRVVLHPDGVEHDRETRSATEETRSEPARNRTRSLGANIVAADPKMRSICRSRRRTGGKSPRDQATSTPDDSTLIVTKTSGRTPALDPTTNKDKLAGACRIDQMKTGFLETQSETLSSNDNPRATVCGLRNERVRADSTCLLIPHLCFSQKSKA